MSLIFIVIIIFAALLEYIGDSNFKLYARSSNNNYLLIGTLAYIVMIGVIIKILKDYANVMYMNGMWDATSIILETLLAYIFLKETLSNKYQLVGFVFVIIGVVLMNVGDIPY
jgi:multidrug transporter EmrE-like cation transporter